MASSLGLAKLFEFREAISALLRLWLRKRRSSCDGRRGLRAPDIWERFRQIHRSSSLATRTQSDAALPTSIRSRRPSRGDASSHFPCKWQRLRPRRSSALPKLLGRRSQRVLRGTNSRLWPRSRPRFAQLRKSRHGPRRPHLHGNAIEFDAASRSRWQRPSVAPWAVASPTTATLPSSVPMALRP